MRSGETTGTARASVIAGAAWVAVDNLSVVFISLATLVLMARLLGPAEFAAAAIAWSVVQLLTPLAGALFHDVIVQRRPLSQRAIQSAWVASIAIGAGLSLLLWPLAPLLARALDLPAVSALLPWMGLSLVLQAVAAVPTAFARRRTRYRALAVRSSVGRLAGSCVGLLAAVLGAGAWSVVAQQVLAAGVAAVLILPRAGLRFRPELFDWSSLRALAGFSALSMAGLTVGTASACFATLIVGMVMGPEEVAFWNLAFRVVDPLQMTLAAAIGQWAAPQLARLQGDPAALRTAYRSVTEMSAYLGMPAFVGLAVCSEDVIRVTMGAPWAPAAGVVSVLALAASLTVPRQVGIVALFAVGRIKLNAATSASCAAAGLLGLAAFGGLGLVPAAFGYAMRLVPLYGFGGRMIQRVLGVKLWDQLRLLGGATMALIAMSLAVLTLQLVAMPDAASVVRLPVSIVVGILVYALIAGFVVKGAARDMVHAIWEHLRRRPSARRTLFAAVLPGRQVTTRVADGH